MEEKLEKYALVLLENCLNIDIDKPLFISVNIERMDFARIISKKAYELGVKEIYYDIVDPYLKYYSLKYLGIDDLKKLSIWNKEIWNEYAKNGASFLILVSETPGLMDDIDQHKMSDIVMYSYTTRKEFDNYRDKQITPWCIAAAPTENWAKKVFKGRENALELLWEQVFEICGINNEDPVTKMNDHIIELDKRTKTLNDYHFKKLRYKNSLGTDFTIDLPYDHIWASGKEKLVNGKEVLVNFPTEEVFTSPDCMSANGIVYSSKPLSYQDNIIDEFSITFKDGVAVDCKAKIGEQTLKELINSCKNANRLGEVALVSHDSPISNSNLVFYETLFDENASCHIALGDSFKECIKDGINMSEEEIKNHNLNICDNHVDFMIGTSDMNITGITNDGEEIEIFVNGNFHI